MKIRVVLLFMLFVTTACDPYNFGFKKNPAYVLNEAFNSITKLNLDKFLEVTGKEALCIYGNPEGLQYLRDNLQFSVENIKIFPKVLSKAHFVTPKFVDYWSYYQERYQIDILDKNTDEVIIKAIVDCEFGMTSKANEYVNIDPESYKKKECSVIKVLSAKFPLLPVTAKCESLRVTL